MCCTCRCRLVEGGVEMDANYSLEPWEMEAGFILSCQARPTTKAVTVDFDNLLTAARSRILSGGYGQAGAGR